MSKVNHEFFGEIDTEKDVDEQFSDDVRVLWEEEYNGIMTTLWYDSGYVFQINFSSSFLFLNRLNLILYLIFIVVTCTFIIF